MNQPQKKNLRRAKKNRHQHGGRHLDADGRVLNGGAGKPRPSAQLPEEQRRDYQFGGRLPNGIGAELDEIMSRTGETKSDLLLRMVLLLLEKLKRLDKRNQPLDSLDE